MQRFKRQLPILVAIAFGWALGGYSPTSPAAAAGEIKVSLQSLKSQIDKILAGTLVVGAAENATFAEFADSAEDANTLDGYDSSDFAKAGQAADWANLTGIPSDIADGDDIGSAGDGLSLSGGTFSVDFSNLDSRYASQDDLSPLQTDVESLMTTIQVLEQRLNQLENMVGP